MAEEYHASWWVEFEGRKPGCVEAVSEAAALSIAHTATGCTAKRAKRLPYPAEPRLNEHLHPEWGRCPSFCFSPATCAGRTACPQRYSCVE